MSRVGFSKKILVAAVIAALGASASVTKAATITMASFTDTLSNKWAYSNATGSLTTSTDTAFFSDLGAGVLNYSGPVKETLSATRLAGAAGNATVDGSGTLSQVFSGTLTFTVNDGGVNQGKTILSVVFATATLSGTPSGTTTSALSADNATLAGSITSFSTDPTFLIGAFAPPLKFSFGLTQIPGLSISGTNFASFTATAAGSFQVDQSGASPTPLPAAAWGGMSLMGALGGFSAFMKRRRK